MLPPLPVDPIADLDLDADGAVLDELDRGRLSLEEPGRLEGRDQESVEHRRSEDDDGGVHEGPRDESVEAVVVHEDWQDKILSQYLNLLESTRGMTY